MKLVASTKSTMITGKRRGLIKEMENLLLTWMEDQVEKCILLRLLMIQAKAISLFETLKVQHDDPVYTQEFTASHGWFKKCHSFHNIKIYGEAAGIDQEGAELFKEEL